MSAKPEDSGKPQGPFSQEFQHSQVSARIPEKVGRGVFTTGVLVQQGVNEFVCDFIQGMAQPRQVVARVVVSPGVFAALINAIRDNLGHYQTQFGPLPTLKPPTPPPTPPSIEEIYGQLKLPDEQLSGVYANAALIAHTQAEFCVDFITNFYPRSAVSCRVYMAAAQLPGLLQTLTQSFQQYQQKMAAQNPRPPELPPPSAS
jgi:hypothetical protein